MKFTKVSANSKTKNASFVEKSKFKSKESAAAPNSKLKKNVKHAADLLKKGSLDKDIASLVKSYHKVRDNVNPLPGTKIKPSKSGKLSPEVQLGLRLDAILDRKSGRKHGIAPSKNGQNMSTSQNESSPKSKIIKTETKTNLRVNRVPPKSVVQIPDSEVETAHRNKRKKKKESSVLKNEFVSSDDISPNENESSPTKKSNSKRKRGNNKTNSSPTSSGCVHVVAKNEEETEVSANSDTVNFTLDPKNILDAVKAALELHQQKSELSNKLLDSEPDPIFLKFVFFVAHPHKKVMRFDLAHSLVRSESDICLFVSDLSKKKSNESKSEWEEILEKENVKNISEVITLKSLLSDYSQYQDKRKLSARFDYFLVDGRISHRVFGILGNKHFHSRRKSPTPVVLTRGNLKLHIDKALLRTVAQYKEAAQSFSVEIGHTGMKDKDIRDNILKIWEQYPKQFGIYWENIRQAALFLQDTPELPIFCSLNPPTGEMRVYKDMTWGKESNIPVVGELSTVNDQKVLVYPSGKVSLKNPVKKELDPEEVAARKLKKKERRKEAKLRAKTNADQQEDCASDDSWAARADMLADSDSEQLEFEEVDLEDEKPKAKKKKAKQNKKMEKAEADDSDEEFDVEKAEEMYLQDIAKQKAKTRGKKAVASTEGSDLDTDGNADLNAFGNGMSDESSDGEEVSLSKSSMKQSPAKYQSKKADLTAKKVEAKKCHSKSGAMKNSSPPSKGKQKKHAGNKSTFQGIKTADQVQKKQKKSKETIRKKAIAKKLK